MGVRDSKPCCITYEDAVRRGKDSRDDDVSKCLPNVNKVLNQTLLQYDLSQLSFQCVVILYMISSRTLSLFSLNSVLHTLHSFSVMLSLTMNVIYLHLFT